MGEKRKKNARPEHPLFTPLTDAQIAAMETDRLDEYHDAILTCIAFEEEDADLLARYRKEAERIEGVLRERGW